MWESWQSQKLIPLDFLFKVLDITTRLYDDLETCRSISWQEIVDHIKEEETKCYELLKFYEEKFYVVFIS